MNKKKILIIDDDHDYQRITSIFLRAHGYEVITASDGVEALKIVRNQKPDLILLDIMLPKTDGFRICRLLKSDTRYRTIPTIFNTCRAGENDKRMATDVGGDDYLVKTPDLDNLLAVIERQLSNR